MFQKLERELMQHAAARAGELQSGKRDAGLTRFLHTLLHEARRRHDYLDRLVVKKRGRLILVAVDEIDWIEAAGNYVRIHAGPCAHLMRVTMNKLQARLDPSRFLRIHRTTIVNIERVCELQPLFHGDFAVLLKSGAQLTLSRTYRAQVQQQLEAAF
jgi:two-component system LytT family response regulator